MTHITTAINFGDLLAVHPLPTASTPVDWDHVDWVNLSPAELVDHVEVVHHRFLWSELPRLCDLIDCVVVAHGNPHPELVDLQHIYAQLQADLELHLIKEEQALFPMIRELASARSMPAFHCGTVRNPIAVMFSEHDHVGDLFARMRLVSNDYAVPNDGGDAYALCYHSLELLETDTYLHVHKENDVLFPAAVALESRMRDAG